MMNLPSGIGVIAIGRWTSVLSEEECTGYCCFSRNPYIPTLFEKAPGVVKSKYCLHARPGPLRIRNLENCYFVQKIRAYESTGQVTFIVR